MLTNAVASNYQQIVTNQTAVPIDSGRPIIIFGIAFGTGGSTTIADGLGNTIFILSLGGNSFELKTGFIADKGIKITTDSTASCTIFYSNAGM